MMRYSSDDTRCWSLRERVCLANTVFDSSQAYKPLDSLPYIANPYTPLYMAASRVTDVLFGNLLMTGRWLSLVSTLGAALAVGWTVPSATSARAPLLLRIAYGVFGGVSALMTDNVVGWSSLLRVDLLAVLLMYAGLGVYIVFGKRERWQYVAAVLFVLAIFTKQTLLSASLA